jgi:uncharacterized protein YkwD
MSKLKTALVLSLILLLSTFLLFAGNLIVKGLKASQSANTDSETFKSLNENVLWFRVNEWRVNNGLDPYIRSEALCEFATPRLKEIKTEFSHAGFERKSGQWLSITGYEVMAENLSFRPRDEATVLNEWLNSPPHREALEENYVYSCIKADDSYAVQLFAR